jgi:hypothetical protein
MLAVAAASVELAEAAATVRRVEVAAVACSSSSKGALTAQAR